MGELSDRAFGLIIAYLLPGFVLLFGLAQVFPGIALWLQASARTDTPSVGSFLYAVLASLTAGMTIGAFRWAIVDRIHHATGLPRPHFRMSSLHDKQTAFELLVDHHYRYYEFFSGTFLAGAASYLTWRFTASPGGPQLSDTGFIAVESVFFAASRDTLRNYYRRVAQLLGTSEEGFIMTNGSGHHEESEVRKPSEPKPQQTSIAVSERDKASPTSQAGVVEREKAQREQK